MDTKIKNYLGIAFVIVLFIFAIAFTSFVSSYGKSIDPATRRSFSVSEEGKVVAIPDIARFTFSVISEGGLDLAAIQEENTKSANKAIDFVKSRDVERRDIKTERYSITPRRQFFPCNPRVLGDTKPCPPPEIVGYTVTQTVSVKIRDFDTIGEILAGVVERGANSVSQISFTIDDPSVIENQARGEAIVKAQEKAKAIAKVGGFRVGELLSITEGFQQPPVFFAESQRAGIGGSDQAVAPTIEPGSQDVTVRVTLTYEIE